MKMTVCPKCQGSGAIADLPAVGRELRQARKVRRKGLREVAEAMGISVTYLHDLEHGRRAWSKEGLSRYRRAIG